MKRAIVEQLERRKEAMVTALWSNSNYDDDKGTRRGAIEELEEKFQEAIVLIEEGAPEEPEEDEIEDNPFFAPALKAVRQLEAPRDDEGMATVKDVVDSDYTKYIDQ